MSTALLQKHAVWWFVAAIALVELFSYVGWHRVEINTFGWVALTLLTFFLAHRNLKFGIFLLFAELSIGSKGYLFSMPIGSFDVSLRLGMFLALFLAYVISVIKERRIHFFTWRFWKHYTALVGVIALGIVIGLFRGNESMHIFLDANGFLYLGLILPLTHAIRSPDDVMQLMRVMLAAIIALMFKTFGLLFFFSHRGFFGDSWISVYKWVRDTGVGEVTWYPNGFVRVFFQSHIYVVFLFFVLLLLLVFTVKRADRLRSFFAEKQTRLLFVLLSLTSGTVFLSYSRSFWVGTAAALFLVGLWILFRLRLPFKRFAVLAGTLLFSGCFGFLIVFTLLNVPLHGSAGVSSSSLITDRTENLSSEPAASSRWQLIRPLLRAGLRHPVFGSGFGATLRYKTADPRVLAEHPDGMQTTYAFEWGYLDLLYKIGIGGVGVYAWLLIALVRETARQIRRQDANEQIFSQQALVAGLLFGTIALMCIHVFTPYLNHPLGIGWLLLVSVAITKRV